MAADYRVADMEAIKFHAKILLSNEFLISHRMIVFASCVIHNMILNRHTVHSFSLFFALLLSSIRKLHICVTMK